MELSPNSHVPDGLLAAMTLLSEKPHQGVPSWESAPHQGIDERNCTALLGLRFRSSEIVSGTVVAPSNYPQFSKKQCSAMRGLLAREAQYGTATAAHMSSNTFGDALLTPFNSTYVPNLQTPVGNLDLDWFTDIRSYSNYANAVNPLFGTAGLYTVAKLSWTAIRAHAGMAIGNAIPFTDPGERTAVVQATLGVSYASIFTPAYMAQVCK